MSNQNSPPDPFIDPETSRLAWLKSLEQRDTKRYFRSGFTVQDQEIGAFERGTINAVGASTGGWKNRVSAFRREPDDHAA